MNKVEPEGAMGPGRVDLSSRAHGDLRGVIRPTGTLREVKSACPTTYLRRSFRPKAWESVIGCVSKVQI